MQIVLGGYTFPEEGVAFSEQRGDVAGRNQRTIRITGLFSGLPSMDAVEALLEEVLAASVAGETETTLTIRPGRALLVRRTGFWRDLNREARAGSFKLDLEAVSPYETAEAPTVLEWTVTNATPSVIADSAGTKWAPPQLALTAVSAMGGISVTDGERTLLYDSEVPAGATLLFDAEAGKVLLDGDDVTAQASGEFPRIAPGETTLTLAALSPTGLDGEAVLTFRDRWW